MKGAVIGGAIVAVLILYVLASMALDKSSRNLFRNPLGVLGWTVGLVAAGAGVGAYIPYMLEYNAKHDSGAGSGGYIGDGFLDEGFPEPIYPELPVVDLYLSPSANDIDCDAFSTQAQAQAQEWYDTHPGDADFLDADFDGYACELLP